MSSIATPKTISINLQRVADYGRLSEDDEKDPELRGENVRIQLDECELFRSSRPDWQHIGSFKDNDISASAYGGEVRPDFDKLMLLVRQSEVEIILCVEVTRLCRKPLEAETLIDLVWSKKTSFYLVATTRGGYYDLRTSAGRKAVRDAVNAAAGESDNISDRVRVKKAAMARKGKPNGGRRAYGYGRDGVTIVEQEATIIREIVDRVLAGESHNHILRDLNERKVPTSEGKQWYKPTITNMLRRKRYAGIREHRGVEYKAVWQPVIDGATFDRLQAVLNANEKVRAMRGNPRKYMLVGYACCGECGRRLGGSMKQDRPSQPKKPRYVCRPYDARRVPTGCGKVSRLAEPLEDLVTEAVLYRLDSADFAAIMAESQEDSEQLRVALDAHQAQKQKLDALLDDYYGDNPDGLTREQFLRGKTAAEATLDRLGRQIEKFSTKQTVGVIPFGQSLRATWKEKKEDLGWRRQVIGLLVDKIIVHAGGGKPRYKRWRFDPGQIEIIWKV